MQEYIWWKQGLLLQVLRCEPDSKILLCAPQGYSADLLASALGQSGVTKNEMIRLADPRHPPPQMKDDVLEKFSNLDYKMRAFTLPDPKIVADKRVVVMTCGAAGILRSGQYKKFHETEKLKAKKESDQKLVGLEFSHVLIDEAGQVQNLISLSKSLARISFPLRPWPQWYALASMKVLE